MVLNHSCHDTQMFNAFNMNATLMVIISLVGKVSRLNLECSYFSVLCGRIHIQDNSNSIEQKIPVVYQNINENNCQSHLFASLVLYKNYSHCMPSCRTCTCGVTLIRSLLNVCLSVLYFLYVFLLFQILNLNTFGLNQLILVVTLFTSQQDKISEYKIWLTICLESASQNIINSFYVFHHYQENLIQLDYLHQ